MIFFVVHSMFWSLEWSRRVKVSYWNVVSGYRCCCDWCMTSQRRKVFIAFFLTTLVVYNILLHFYPCNRYFYASFLSALRTLLEHHQSVSFNWEISKIQKQMAANGQNNKPLRLQNEKSATVPQEKQERHFTYKHNSKGLSRDYCCRYIFWMRVCGMARIILLSVACPARPYLSALSYKRHDSEKKILN